MKTLFLAEKSEEQWDERLALSSRQMQESQHSHLYETDKVWGEIACTHCQSYGDHNASTCPSSARRTQEQLDHLNGGF